MNNNNALRIIKNTAALFGGRAATLLFSFFFVVYVARYMGVDGFGKYSLVRGYFELFLSLTAAALGIIVTRDIAQNADSIHQTLSVSIVFSIVLTVVCSLVLVLIALLSHYEADVWIALLFTCVALLPATISEQVQSVFRGIERAEFITYVTVFENIFRIVLSLISLLMGYGLVALFVIHIISRTVMLIACWIIAKRLCPALHWAYSHSALKAMWRAWRIFAAENWLSNVFNSLDTILLSWFSTNTMIGLYSAANKILSMGGQLAISFTTAAFPYLTQLYSRSQQRFWQVIGNVLKVMLAAMLPIVILTIALSSNVVNLLFSAEFADAASILNVLMWALLLRFLNMFLSYVLFAQGKQERSMLVAAISLAIYFVAGIWLTQQYAAMGVSLARVLAMLIAFVLYCVLAFNEEQLHNLLGVIVKTGLAGLGVGGLVVFARNSLELIPVLSLALLAYTALLFAFGIVTLRQLDRLRQAFNNMLQRVRMRRSGALF